METQREASPAAAEHAHFPALDGLRAVAIFGVFVYHVCNAAMPGGFAGVDVFFVLSGFLITSIILREKETGTFSFGEFYLRRIQRLLPNALAVIACTLVLWIFLLPVGQEIDAGKHGVWTLFYASNIYIWKFLGTYWGIPADFAPFTHFWSLGVEEQFYILFPVCLLALLALRRGIAKIALPVATAASFALCFYGTTHFPVANFYLLPSRVWELLLGASLALAGGGLFAANGTPNATGGGGRVAGALGWAGLGLIAVSFFWTDAGGMGFPGWVVALPTLGSVLVLRAIAARRATLTRALSWRPFVAVGKISYSLYLWHWPLIVLGRNRAHYADVPLLWGTAAGGAVSIALAAAAYCFIERPLRKRGAGRGARLAVIVGGFCVVLALCVFAATRPGYKPSRYAPVVSSLNLYAINLQPLPAPQRPWFDLLPAERPGVDGRGTDAVLRFWPAPAGYDRGAIFRGILRPHAGTGAAPDVFVWGSSHACMYSKVIDDICAGRKLSASFWGWAATPLFPEQRNGGGTTGGARDALLTRFYAARAKVLRDANPRILFLISPWKEAGLEADLRTLLADLRRWNLRTRVIFVRQNPALRHGLIDNPRAVLDFLSTGGAPAKLRPNEGEAERLRCAEIAERLAAEDSRLAVIAPDKIFRNPDGSVRYAAGRDFFYLDWNHLSDAGAAAARPVFEEVLAVPPPAAPVPLLAP
ncbi:MAG: acyltransferase [Puniceicoccales bacterium]|jgi:peptidoglycan/LPS O-acetylase OafA/YrhL|nr:acyltransferase [Puniceicoccales bacterium]